MKDQILLYGANGYTGELIARMAKEFDLALVLAGRNEAPIVALAKLLNFDYLVIDLDELERSPHYLAPFKLVIHAAGPFKYTAMKMIRACIASNTHYLDITGEIQVFEQAQQFHELAMASNIMIMPGVGFDVVPTDCLSLFLKKQLPDANSLELAIGSLGSSISRGTANTMVENLGGKGAVRKDGKLILENLGKQGMQVDFGLKKLFVMSIPWGDLSTAYYTTRIPNIQTFAATSKKTYQLLKWQYLYNWLLQTRWIKKIVQKRIRENPAGPTLFQREHAKSLVWGRVMNSHHQQVVSRLIGPEGYTLTATSALIICKKVMNGEWKPGYQTPASCYGEDLIFEIPGMKREIL